MDMMAQGRKNVTKANQRSTKETTNSWKVPTHSRMHAEDTLSIADRIAVRTNMLDWLLLIPNVGAEFDLKGKSWNRWAVGFNVRGNWQTSHTYKPGLVFNLREARVEARQYWHTRDMKAEKQKVKVRKDSLSEEIEKDTVIYNALQPHKKIWDKALSIRRKTAKHPLTTYFRGAYASYTDFSFKFGTTGRQGTAIMAGFLYGIQRPVHDFANGNSLSLEASIAVGGMMTRYDEFTHDVESDCYPIKKHQDWKLVMHPVINDISVGLVYRFGKTPATHKYRYRYDVDEKYRNETDEKIAARQHRRDSTRNYKITYDSVSREFWHLYDEIALKGNTIAVDHEKRLQMDEERRQRKADAKARRKEEKKNKKAQKAANKAAGKADDNTAVPADGEGKEGANE